MLQIKLNENNDKNISLAASLGNSFVMVLDLASCKNNCIEFVSWLAIPWKQLLA